MNKSPEQILRGYREFFESLSPQTLSDLERFVTNDIVFQDPFNDVRGAAEFRKVFEDMFRKTRNPIFRVTEAAASGNTGFLRWRFECLLRSKIAGESLTIHGVSAIRWNAEGLVNEHIDYWDAGANVYERLPVFGHFLRLIKKAFAA